MQTSSALHEVLSIKRLAKVFLSFIFCLLLTLNSAAPAYALFGLGDKRIVDEAMKAGRSAASLPSSEEDYFKDMDYGLTKKPEQVRVLLDKYVPGISADDAVNAVVRGRNNWIVWTGGNDAFWDVLSRKSFGNLDFLKTLSSHPALENSRDNRWINLGVVNEPCFKQATGPRPDRFGLWLDERVGGPECPADPYENEEKYPGVKIGARGTESLPVGSYYGYSSGVVGLRLFPNPAFDAKAQKKWDPVRYYTDASYYNDKDLVKPYRVGMSCAFCHVGPNPTHPPKDFNAPKFADLNSNPGAQYFWIDRIFSYAPDDKNFIYQLLHTSRPGALDTSLVSSDQINNPRTMNAVYELGARIELAQKWGHEKLAGGELDNKQFSDFAEPVGPIPSTSPLVKLSSGDSVYTPHVLKDGSDAVGGLGALNRVFINIGLFSEEWLRHFIPLVGGPKITPIKIATAQKNSVYWQATTQQTPDTALFFLAASPPDRLKDAPGGQAYLTKDETILDHGKEVFAVNCARCHSSKLPEKAFAEFFPDQGCNGPDYLKCWNDYWAWTKTSEFKDEIKKIVAAPDFLDHNYLSTDLRIPVTLLETNAGSPLATNAIAGDIWNDFSSSTYKQLPSVGEITVHHPITGDPYPYAMPAGGRGYTRVPSLVSLWSTAPFLLNNSVGDFKPEGTVEARMQSFDSSIGQLLWPEKRKGNGMFVTASGKSAPGWIDRTSATSFLTLSSGFLPGFLRPKLYILHRLFPNVPLFSDQGLQIGPIPKGTPVNLLSNIDLKKKAEILKLVPQILGSLKQVTAESSDEDIQQAFLPLVDPLLEVNKSPDFVINRGHYFGTDFLPESEGEVPLTENDKKALIEYLKTM